ncbi:MAG: hypothetical protein LBS50_11245 [Prevotellaceae bacterium]|jgi:hypothetical protein|nr:hypothetical protein [Prevotellaceae bacterium]
MKKLVLLSLAALLLTACKEELPVLTFEQKVEKNIAEHFVPYNQFVTYENIKVISCEQVDYPIDSVKHYVYCKEQAQKYSDSIVNFNEAEYYESQIYLYHDIYHGMSAADFLEVLQGFVDGYSQTAAEIENLYTEQNFKVICEYLSTLKGYSTYSETKGMGYYCIVSKYNSVQHFLVNTSSQIIGSINGFFELTSTEEYEITKEEYEEVFN